MDGQGVRPRLGGRKGFIVRRADPRFQGDYAVVRLEKPPGARVRAAVETGKQGGLGFRQCASGRGVQCAQHSASVCCAGREKTLFRGHRAEQDPKAAAGASRGRAARHFSCVARRRFPGVCSAGCLLPEIVRALPASWKKFFAVFKAKLWCLEMVNFIEVLEGFGCLVFGMSMCMSMSIWNGFGINEVMELEWINETKRSTVRFCCQNVDFAKFWKLKS